MDPEAVAGEQVGRLGNGQSNGAPFDMDVDFRTGQIKRGTLCSPDRDCQNPNQGEGYLQDTAHLLYCTENRRGGEPDEV